MAQWVKATGEILEVTPQPKKKTKSAKYVKFSLDELQSFVGGYIERVQLEDKMDMIVNEEGRLTGLPYNRAASAIAGQMIVGDVVICARGEW